MWRALVTAVLLAVLLLPRGPAVARLIACEHHHVVHLGPCCPDDEATAGKHDAHHGHDCCHALPDHGRDQGLVATHAPPPVPAVVDRVPAPLFVVRAAPVGSTPRRLRAPPALGPPRPPEDLAPTTPVWLKVRSLRV